MNIKYNKTRIVTTADLGIACDPPIYFEVKANVPSHWARLQLDWEEQGADDIGLAINLVGDAFLMAWQDESEKYLINSRDQVEALRDAIEESSPGEGDNFICHLALTFAREHFRFLARNSAAYGRPSLQLNGNKSKKRRVKA